MSVLDQLEESFNLTGQNNSGLGYTSDDWVVANTALAAHQTMRRGHNIQESVFVPGTRSPINSTTGSVNVLKSLEIAQNYRDLLIRSQTTPIGLRPTSDDVVDGGIKNGSKVVLQIVDESNRQRNWDDQIKSNIRTNAVEGVLFDKFSVASFVESEDERYQIHETFGADIIQSFGRRPRFLTIAGIVVNGRIDVRVGTETRSMDWKNAFQRQYERNFSLRACLTNRKKVRIYFQDTVYDGYLLQMTAATDAENQGISQVTVRAVVQNRYFSRQRDENIPGSFTGDGFRLTGKDVPEEFFPQDKLEFYFQEDYTSVLEGANRLLSEEIESLAETLSNFDSNITSADIIRERAETLTLGLSTSLEDNNYPTDLKLTPLLKGGNVESTIKFVIEGIREGLTRRGLSNRIANINKTAERLLSKQKEFNELNKILANATQLEIAAVELSNNA